MRNLLPVLTINNSEPLLSSRGGRKADAAISVLKVYSNDKNERFAINFNET